MPRRKQDGRAARAGATHSVADAIDITGIFKLLGATEAESKIERHTKALDTAYFDQHPHAEARQHVEAVALQKALGGQA